MQAPHPTVRREGRRALGAGGIGDLAISPPEPSGVQYLAARSTLTGEHLAAYVGT